MAYSGIRISSKSMRFRIAAVVSLIVVLLIALLIGSNIYAIGVIRSQVFKTYSVTLNLQMQRIENDLDSVNTFLTGVINDSSDLQLIKQYKDDWSLAAVREQKRLTLAMPSFGSINGLFIYEPDNNVWLDSTSANYSNSRRLLIKQQIINDLTMDKTKTMNGMWNSTEINGKFILTRVIMLHGCYIGAWTEAAQLTKGLEIDSPSELAHVFISDAQGNPLSSSAELSGLHINPASASQHYQLAGSGDRWLMVAQSNRQGNLYLVALVRDNSILEGLDNFTMLLLIVAVCSIGVILLLIFTMRRYLMHPLKKLTRAMHDLQLGDWNVHLPEQDTVDEFVEVNATFNYMVEQIQDLKISVYEEKLTKKNIEMQMLKQQLTPHTLVNCLNTIHGLAGTGDTALIQEMSVELGNYLRYTMSTPKVVRLKDELEHVRNYVRLSAIRFHDSIELVEEVDSDTLDAYIPPLLLQTFVENTIKYEVLPGEKTYIHLQVSRQADSLHLLVWDTGEGYSQESLDYLASQGSAPADESGRRIGLTNLRQRILLLFGADRSAVIFSNRSNSGAQMEITLPYLDKWEDER